MHNKRSVHKTNIFIILHFHCDRAFGNTRTLNKVDLKYVVELRLYPKYNITVQIDLRQYRIKAKFLSTTTFKECKKIKLFV